MFTGFVMTLKGSHINGIKPLRYFFLFFAVSTLPILVSSYIIANPVLVDRMIVNNQELYGTISLWTGAFNMVMQSLGFISIIVFIKKYRKPLDKTTSYEAYDDNHYAYED
jgi:hypothetical protein